MVLPLPKRQRSTTLDPIRDRDLQLIGYVVSGTTPAPDWIPFWHGLLFLAGGFLVDPVKEWLVRNDNPEVVGQLEFAKEYLSGGKDWGRFLSFCRPDAWPSLADYLGKLTNINWSARTLATSFLHKAILCDPRQKQPFPGEAWLQSWRTFVQNGTLGSPPAPMIVEVVGVATPSHTWYLESAAQAYVSDAGPDEGTANLQKLYFTSSHP